MDSQGRLICCNTHGTPYGQPLLLIEMEDEGIGGRLDLDNSMEVVPRTSKPIAEEAQGSLSEMRQGLLILDAISTVDSVI